MNIDTKFSLLVTPEFRCSDAGEDPWWFCEYIVLGAGNTQEKAYEDWVRQMRCMATGYYNE
jgi:hypothetical protein